MNSLSWIAYTQPELAQTWEQTVRGRQPNFVGCFGFTNTGLIPGISAAGATPEARRMTALADAEVLIKGYSSRLPTSPDGYPSPVVISRAVIQDLQLPYYLFNCGLTESLEGLIELDGSPAHCLSTGQALPLQIVNHLFQQGTHWGQQLSKMGGYLVIGECVVGGTTTALAVLTGLGYQVAGMVNSSHPICNHDQKRALVKQGLAQISTHPTVLEVVAAVGDPMQPFVAGLALSASKQCPVLLAGGTQMLAVYALMQRWIQEQYLDWQPRSIAVGTTRWVAADPTGNTVGLAQVLGTVPLLATQLSFANSRYETLQAYERGFVKEGIGAGGLSIAASLYQQWGQDQLLQSIESMYTQLLTG